MNTYEDAPNPFSTDPSPPGTPRHEHASTRSLEGTPTAPQSPLPSHEALEASRGGSKDGSVVSAASGSPPPTYRAGFPEPGVKSYVGPKVKEGNCCERDAELQAGVEISVCRVWMWDVICAYCLLTVDCGCRKDNGRWKDELYYLCHQDGSQYRVALSSTATNAISIEPRMPSSLLGIRLPPYLPRRPLPRPHRSPNPIKTIPNRLRRERTKQGEGGCDGDCEADEDAGGLLEKGCKASDFEWGARFSSVFG